MDNPDISPSLPSSTTELPQLFWEGSQFAHHSFSHVNRELCLALLRQGGLDLTLVPYERDQFDPSSIARFAPLVNALSSRKIPSMPPLMGKRLWLRHHFPLRRIRPPNASWLVYHPWEYSVSPVAMVEVMKETREVWTTSQFCVDAFVRSGVDADKIQIIPNGVNLDIFTPEGPAAELPTTKPFKFIFVGGTIYRKGVDLLLEAYGRAFTSEDPVSLVIKDLGVNEFYRGQTSGNIIQEFAAKPGNPEVVYLTDYRTNQEMAALFRACDVFVSSYRGEGFCLPALEAMASGLPAIVTKGGSTDDFVSENSGWFIPAGLKSVGYSIFKMPTRTEAHFLEPNIDALVEILREAYRNETARRAKAAAAAAEAKNWSWDHAAKRVLARCQTLAAS